MIHKKLDEITIEDVNELKVNEVCESKTIEYKEKLNIEIKDVKKEFLADISSFANTEGGDILFGIQEDGGKIIDLPGISVSDLDQEKLKIESIVRDGIEPRVAIHIKEILLTEDKWIVIIRVKKSYNKPHRVIYGKDNRFFARHSAGKFPLDVHQLKTMFNSSLVTQSLIKNFHSERLQDIKQNNIPIMISGNARLVVHIIPYEAFTQDENYDVFNEEIMRDLHTIDKSYCQPTINFEGVYTYSSGTNKYAFTQLYRNGLIEVVYSRIFYGNTENGSLLKQKILEERVIEYIGKCMTLQKNLGVTLPLYIYISLLGIKDYKILLPHAFFEEYTNLAFNDNLVLPGVYISSYETLLDVELQKSFDLIWNAFGREKSIYYNEAGQRINFK